MKKLQVLIIDDERSARAELRRLLGSFPDFDISGEARNADEAAELIQLKQPDILFLDIRMPERTGFDLLESLPVVPQVVFTTAFDQYAVKAFEVNAFDYLLKPVREERFAQTITKLRDHFRLSVQEKKVFVKDGDRYLFVKWNEVHLIESMDNYARIFFNTRNAWLKISLTQLEKMLDESMFFRANRAQVINMDFIESIDVASNGSLLVHLRTGHEVQISERRSVQFKKLRKI